MKKIVLLSYLFLVLTSCDEKSNFYHGVIVDIDKNPISNVKVSMEFNQSESTFSQENGYFKLSKSPDILASLVFKKDNFITDTIPSILTQRGEVLIYNFLNKKPDTIKLMKY